MHILIAGATGAAGRALIPLLIANGHTVTGTTRSEAKAGELRALGANAQIMDGLDAASVKAAVEAAQPDVIVHQMTALTGIDMKNIDKAFRAHQPAADRGHRAPARGRQGQAADRAVLRRLAVRAHRRPGQDRGRPAGPRRRRRASARPTPRSAGSKQLTTEAGGIVLRYGGFYGPGTGMAPGGEQAEMIRKRQFPLVGNGDGIWSFLHTDDLATATLAAIEHGRPGEIYNIVDDEPAPDQGVAAVPGRSSSAPSRRARSRRGSRRSSRARPRWR